MRPTFLQEILVSSSLSFGQFLPKDPKLCKSGNCAHLAHLCLPDSRMRNSVCVPCTSVEWLNELDQRVQSWVCCLPFVSLTLLALPLSRHPPRLRLGVPLEHLPLCQLCLTMPGCPSVHMPSPHTRPPDGSPGECPCTGLSSAPLGCHDYLGRECLLALPHLMAAEWIAFWEWKGKTGREGKKRGKWEEKRRRTSYFFVF